MNDFIKGVAALSCMSIAISNMWIVFNLAQIVELAQAGAFR